MEPICEAKFSENSYGFRPNRSAENAIARAEFLIQNTRLHYVVEFDVKGFFDNVDHSKLIKQIWSLGIRDKNLLFVLKRILKAPIRLENGAMEYPTKGTPQGGIISPLLANIVLNELDQWVDSQWQDNPVTVTASASAFTRWNSNPKANKKSPGPLEDAGGFLFAHKKRRAADNKRKKEVALLFVDIAKIRIKAGDGGNGAVSFRREKYVAAGGPDGGDGGRGGNIVFQADTNLSTLADFRYQRKYTAQNGENGRGSRCNGKSAPDLVIRVPLGTVVKDAETGRIIADLSDYEPHVAAKGGKGGWGNIHFATATRQVPRFAKPGIPGEALEVTLELKLLADVGLVGFPNVGKSTLVSVVSEAKPVIADYHFTTLTPVLGVVHMGESYFVMADIPVFAQRI